MLLDPEGFEEIMLTSRLRRGAVVEIGCGDGRVTRRYSARVKSVIAIDPDAAAIAAFRATGVPANVDPRAIPVDQFEIPNGTVDTVLFSWSL